MGFRKFWNFYQALLSKLAWWILSEKDSLCVKVLRAKYKVRGNWLNHKTMGSPSKIWRSLEGMKSLLACSACMLIGNGNTVRIWEDPWILDLPNFIPSPREGTSPEMTLIVSQLLSQEGWDLTKIRNTFDETTSQLIQKIPLSWLAPKDCWIWISNNLGEFSVKSAYWLSRNISPPINQDTIRGLIWKSKSMKGSKCTCGVLRQIAYLLKIV